MKEKLTYNEALKQAQELGFAESNPALDVEGIDAVNKLSIVLKHAYGIDALPQTILHKGITQLHEADAKFAQEKGYSIKLIANAIHTKEQEVIAFVLPTFIDASNQLFSVRNEFNGVLIGSKLADQQFLYGKGAGRYPTSSAVLSDIAALRYNYQYEYKKSTNLAQYQLSDDCYLRIYISFPQQITSIEKDFLLVEESYKSAQRNYIIGTIDFEVLKKSAWLHDASVSIIVMGEGAVHSYEKVQVQSFENV